jgi:hypothetical protein
LRFRDRSIKRRAFAFGYLDYPDRRDPAAALKCARIGKKDRPAIDPFSIQDAEVFIATVTVYMLKYFKPKRNDLVNKNLHPPAIIPSGEPMKYSRRTFARLALARSSMAVSLSCLHHRSLVISVLEAFVALDPVGPLAQPVGACSAGR